MKSLEEIKERHYGEYWNVICWDIDIEGKEGYYYHLGWRDALAWVIEEELKKEREEIIVSNAIRLMFGDNGG